MTPVPPATPTHSLPTIMSHRLAYADPPYLGCGKRLYSQHHPEAAIWDDLNTHIQLLQDLNNYDGWAYSLTSTSLPLILPHTPANSRIAAWVKPFAAWRPNHRVQYTWEPVIFKTARPKGGRGIPSIRDHVSANITMRKGLPGAKPEAFCDWILELIGWQPGDSVNDMFPGTHSLAAAIARRTT